MKLRHRDVGGRAPTSGTTTGERRQRRPRSRVRAGDLVAEAAAAISRRPARALLTSLGTVVGVGAFVATTGLASTARAQVGESFDALKATEVRVIDAAPDGTNPFPDDVEGLAAQLTGVNDAGTLWSIDRGQLDVRAAARPAARPSNIPVVAASPGALRATRPSLRTGTLIDEFHNDRRERVAVVGRAAADQLRLWHVDNQPAVFIGNVAYTVIGILEDVQRSPEMLLAVIIPASTATALIPTASAEYNVLVDVDPGAAEVVGGQIAVALRPDSSNRLQVIVPPDPKMLRQTVESDVTGLLYGLAGLALLVGMIGIANTTLVAVLERRSEIGVRRALGALRRHIAAQFLAESATLGAVGGTLGTALGIGAVAVVSTLRQWTTTIDPQLVMLAPLVGVATGLVAGLHPAIRASRMQPAAALHTQ